MTTRLNQIIAVEKSIKARAAAALTEAYHSMQRIEPLSGIARTYRPKDEEGEHLPPESKKVQVLAKDTIDKVVTSMSEYYDVTVAKADIVIDGKTILKDAPVTYLLFLEKQLVDIRTFISKLPTLDPTETWTFDAAQNCFVNESTETTRTKKVLRNHVRAEATDKHPAQVDTYTEDAVIGYWKTVKFSGAMSAVKVAQLLSKVEKLQESVKFAREAANSTEVLSPKVGKPLFAWLFTE